VKRELRNGVFNRGYDRSQKNTSDEWCVEKTSSVEKVKKGILNWE